MDYLEQTRRGQQVEVQRVVRGLLAQEQLKLFLGKELAVFALFAKLLHVLHVYVVVASFLCPLFSDLMVDHLYLFRNVAIQLL